MNPQCPSRKSDGHCFFGEACPRRALRRFLESRQGGFHAPYAAKEERTVMAKLLLGKPVIDSLREELKGRIAALEERGVKPGLAIVRVGARPDDLAYERTALYGETLEITAYSPEIDTELKIVCFPTFSGHCGCMLFDRRRIQTAQSSTSEANLTKP